MPGSIAARRIATRSSRLRGGARSPAVGCPPPLWSVRPIRAICIAAFAVPAFAWAQTGGYAVDIDAPRAVSKLLDENLEIVRHKADKELEAGELDRLIAITPQQIRDLLATEGYFSPTIRHELSPAGERPSVRFTVDPGEPTVIGSVKVEFEGHIAESKSEGSDARMARLRGNWSLKPGERFRQSAWDDAKNEVLKDLLNRDYPAARIADSLARVEPEKRTADLDVRVDSGPPFTFGVLELTGLKRYPRERVEMLNPIVPGEPYSQERLNELQSRLQDSGYFKSAFTTVDVDPAHPDRAPVRVDLSENERFKLSLGVGYSTDAGPRVEAKWLDRIFFGRDWRLETETKLDRLSQTLGARLTLPPLDNGLWGDWMKGWIPSIASRYAHTNITNEINDKIRNDLRLTSPDKNNEHAWGVSHLIDRQRLPDADPNNRQAKIAVYTYTQRRLDAELAPTKGYVAGVELDAGPPGLNEKALARVFAQITWLHPLSNRVTAVVRAQYGQVVGGTRETVPDDLLFRTGGDQTVRGYAYNTLGVSAHDAIVGGTVMALLSGEMQYWFTPQWGAAVFSDMGNATESWKDFKFAHGSGVGARYRSPIGPVNLDVAYNHETHGVRLHFSVGYGF